jgi:hypothetical protein
MDKMMREQLKLTPRRANLAILTRVLILCKPVSKETIKHECQAFTYQVASLFLLGIHLSLLQDVLLTKGRAEGVVELPGRRSRHLHGALEGGFGSHWDGNRFALVDVTEANVAGLGLSNLGSNRVGKGVLRVDG